MRPPLTTPLLVLLAIALLGFGGGVGGCGSRVKAQSSTPQHYVFKDRDNDGDNNNDDTKSLGYGHAASLTDAQAITALLVRYYRASATENGAQACSMLYPFVAESIVESYADDPTLSGKSCAVSMTKLFKKNHKALATESAEFKVYAIRVNGDRGLAVLTFATLPAVRQIMERRYRDGWRVLWVLDSQME